MTDMDSQWLMIFFNFAEKISGIIICLLVVAIIKYICNRRNINFFCFGKYTSEFEEAYNKLINSELSEIKKEKRRRIKNVVIAFFISLMMIMISIILIKSKLINAETAYLVWIVIFSLELLWLIKDKRMMPYKRSVIKNLISIINSNIDYHLEYKGMNEKVIWPKYDDITGLQKVTGDWAIITDTITYQNHNHNNSKIKIDDVKLYEDNSYGDGDTRESVSFAGFIVEISRENFNNKEFLIHKKLNILGSSKEFDKIFRFSTNEKDGFELADWMKNKLVELDNKYQINFEISVKKQKIFIVFFTNDMFEERGSRFFGTINKKVLLYEYERLKGVLNIINEIDNMF